MKAIEHRSLNHSMESSRRNLVVTILSIFGFAAIYPFMIDLVDQAAAQVAFGAVLSTAYGYVLGYLHSGRSKVRYIAIAGLVGAAVLAAISIYITVFYSGAPFLATWFFRYGVATMLLCMAGEFTGDLVRRKQYSLSSGAPSAVIAVAGLIVGILQLLGGS